MFQRFRLAVRRWLALRTFPQGRPISSYIFVDVFVPYGGLHERVMVYQHKGNVFLHFRSTSPLSPKDQVYVKTVTQEALNELFAWIEEQLPNAVNVFLTDVQHDPVRLIMFAFDSDRNRTYSVFVSDIRLYEEFKNLRRQLFDRIQCMAS
jgi:hypothetical protein